MPDDTQRYSFWDTVCQDAAAAHHKIDPKAPLISRILQVRRLMRHKIGFACVFWLRVNQLFIRKGWYGQTRIYMWRQYRFANDISPYADIGPGLYLPHPSDVMIGASVKIGKNANIFNNITLVGLKHEHHLPRLGDNVTIYTGAKVIKPVQIGDNATLGALTLCDVDVPPNSVMYGIPPHVTIRSQRLPPSGDNKELLPKYTPREREPQIECD